MGLAFFEIIAGISCICVGAWMASDGVPLFPVIFILFGGFMILLGFFTPSMLEEEAKKQREEEEKQREEEERKKYEKAELIYDKLTNDFGIKKFETEYEKDALLTVVRTFHPEVTLSEANEFFERGKKNHFDRIKEEEKARFESMRKEEDEIYSEQSKIAHIFGKEKYTYIAKAHQTMDKVYSALRNAQISGATDMLHKQATKSDWAIWGGIANALGGVGAGFATAYDIQRQNEKAELEAAETRRQAQQALDYYKANPVTKYHTSSEASGMEYIESRLYKDSDQAELFKSLKFNNVKLTTTKGKNFAIQGKIDCPSSFKLLNRLSVLDGSIKILIKDKITGNEVASGYYAAPGKDNMNLSEVGFYPGIVFQALCKCDCFSTLKENIEDYTYEFEPLKLWLIEI